MYIGNAKLTEMKHLMTLMTLVVAVTAGAQTYYFPHNHDSNQDGFIGVDDLMSLLSEYGQVSGLMTDIVLPENQFDDFEQFIYDFWNEEIVMDSMYIHFRAEAEHTWFPIGSNESETDTIVYERETMIPWNSNWDLSNGSVTFFDSEGIGFWLNHGGSDGGTYGVVLNDNSAANAYLQTIGFFPHRFVTEHYWHIDSGLSESIWSMDQNGWDFGPMTYSGGVVPLTAFECIPYWHYAE
tara:strand:+ start:133 stop:846 length:714 start_codon:yes stop_codon:yes gene_type:complete